MDYQNISQAEKPRRKRKSKLQIFKETLLPLVIAGIAIIFILVFIIGSIVRGVQKNIYENKLEQAASEAHAALMAEQTKEAENILNEAKLMCAGYDYYGAAALIESFSGNIEIFPALKALYNQSVEGKNSLVKWTDTNTILNLSFNFKFYKTS